MTKPEVEHSILDTIFTRRSIRRYKPDSVPRDMVELILSAAMHAPSAHNRQPWRFAVVEQSDAKETLARAMGARLRRDQPSRTTPLDDLNGVQYHPHWLHNLLIASSMGGLRH